MSAKFLFHCVAVFKKVTSILHVDDFITSTGNSFFMRLSKTWTLLSFPWPHFSKFVYLQIMRLAITFCRQRQITSRNFTMWTFRILRLSPVLIASKAQSSFNIRNFSATSRSRALLIDFLSSLNPIVRPTKSGSLIGNWLFASINDAKRDTLGYDITHGSTSNAIVTPSVVPATRRQHNIDELIIADIFCLCKVVFL